MAELVATVALETLRDLLVEESRFLTDVGGRVEDVRRQLDKMHCFLKDADRRMDRLKSESIPEWLRQLRDLAIEAEQVLEMHAVEVMSKREGKKIMNSLKRFACILGECWRVHHTGKRAEDIVARMAELTRWSDSITIRDSSLNIVEDPLDLSRKTYGHEVEEHFVGMKSEMKHLTSLVTSDERSSRVICICGMGGLGKTTLARKVYQDNSVQRCFDAKAWVSVSQKFRPKAILQELLKQLAPEEKVEDPSVEDLVRQLYNIQKEKKCLIVLDDVWEAEHWNSLSSGFPIAESCCKVLITSRNENVAGTEYVYKLNVLSEDEGWELLYRVALSTNHSPELSTTYLQQMEELGREIVRKCGLLPLAISVIGGILRGEESLREWEKVLSSIDSYLRHGKGIEQDKRVNGVLDLSYEALPYNLKPCFLYLGCFEEDEEIDVEHLYLIWIAEGLISSGEKGRGETLRDVAEHYLHELACRCMIQVKLDNISTYKRFAWCRLHDLVRELCLLKAEEEKFLEAVDKEKGSDDSTIHGVHRLVDNQDSGEGYKRRHPNLQTLMVRRDYLFVDSYGYVRKRFDPPPLSTAPVTELSSINLGWFKYLKILILEGLYFKNRKLPKSIKRLVLLKHLTIRRCNVATLPSAVCKLPHLQSMILTYLEVPNLLQKMKSLSYLDLVGAGRKAISGKKIEIRWPK